MCLSCIGCAPEQQMTYAGSKNLVIQEGEFTQVLNNISEIGYYIIITIIIYYLILIKAGFT